MTNAAKKNVALTVNGTTIVRPIAHLPGCKKAARTAADLGKVVTLKSTTAPLTDVTTGLEASHSCEDCECCGQFGALHYWVEMQWGSFAWACPNCAASAAIHKLAKSA
jgi:hypothetical protein